ncbi:MAG: FAD-binding domain-containing protein, partial [bacterium]
ASTGTDAAPYFRIFNPALQSAKFDPDGSFIKEFVPELRGVPAEFIHEPQSAPMQVLAKLDYPAPIIDRAESKERVLAAFRGVGDVSAG